MRATVPAGDLVCAIREVLSVPTEFKEPKTPLEAQLPAILASLERWSGEFEQPVKWEICLKAAMIAADQETI